MMDQPPSDLDLMAYADGETASPAREAVAGYVEQNAAASRKVLMMQQLRDTSRRVMHDAGPAVPAGLLERVQHLADAPASPRQRWRIGWALSLAALILVGVGLAYYSMQPATGGVLITQAIGVIPASTTDATLGQHALCARYIDHHFHPGFARDLQELPTDLQSYLGRSAQAPDLKGLGYEFAGCGPCEIPGGKTAHMLYRPQGGGKGAVSLFVQANTGQLPLVRGKVYYVSNPSAAGKPMLIWQGGDVIYYLVGDADAILKSVAQKMGLAVRI